MKRLTIGLGHLNAAAAAKDLHTVTILDSGGGVSIVLDLLEMAYNHVGFVG
jgi:hypothetical protein